MIYGDLLFSLFINLQSHFKKNIKIPDLSFQQIIALLIVPEEGIEMSELSNKLGIDNSTATRLVSGLINKNLIIKSKSKNDSRVRIVQLSQQGYKIQLRVELKIENLGKKFDCLIDASSHQEVMEFISSMNWELIKSSIKK
tara:strand:+ start:844 stop:1266 length:423 start_codon:yes stop_codon:yes gene_type:complete